MSKMKKMTPTSDMANCKLLHESAPGSRWARHAVLPANLTKDAGFSSASKSFTVSAKVSKARGRDICQDVAMAIAEEGQNVVGVFDGYEKLGDDLPTELARAMSGLWQVRNDTVNSCEAAEAFIRDAAMLAVRRLREIYNIEEDPGRLEPTPKLFRGPEDLPYGGSTAMLAFTFPGGRFIVAGVGDSACYIVRPDGKAERLFNYNTIVIPDWSREFPLDGLGVRPVEYATDRNRLIQSVTGDKVEKVETMEGELEKGGMLILASDGVTKNLAIETDENGRVKEAGGCRDIEEIAGKRKEEAADAIMKTVLERAGKPPGYKNPIGMPGNRVLLPADDDISLVVVHRKA